MSTPTGVPRARIDPIRAPADAIALVSTVLDGPGIDQTVAVFLDDAGFGDLIVVIDDTESPDAIVAIADVLAQAAAHHPMITTLLLATARSWGGVVDDDIDRWLEASDVVDQHGLRLVEWYVVGPEGVESPRDLLGEPERW
jgi:hypothetical protein